MSEEMNGAFDANKAAEAINKASDQVNKYSGMVDGFVNKALGFITEHPWEQWLANVNKYIGMFLPAVVAISGVLGVTFYIITAIKKHMPIQTVIAAVLVFVLVALSMHLSGKASALVASFIGKREPFAVRPELLYIVKAVFGLGGAALAVAAIMQFQFNLFYGALAVIFIAVLMMIVSSHPEIIGFKADYPKNAVEEAIAIVMFPVNLLIAFLPIITGIVTVGVFGYGIKMTFTAFEMSSRFLISGSMLPLVIPIVAYVAYLVIVFWFDLYRAVVSIPRKLDEIIAK